MGRNSDSVPNAVNSADAAAVFKWRHLAHRGQMLSKSMLRSECWVSVPNPDMQRSDIAGRPSCLSSRCLLDSSCHDRHIVSELLHLAKQIDLPTAQKLFQATKDLFAWKRFEQTPMLFYPSLKSQVWFGEEDYPELLGAVLQHFATIKEEFLNTFQQRGGKLTPLEEEYSGRQGWWCWDVWSAVDGWEKERCEQLPTLCRVLRPHLPHSKSSTLAAYLQEEVALFGLPAGEKYFAMHNDGSNARVALLIPLTQGEHSALVVNGERRSFGGDGRVLGFDASFDHEATYNSPSGEERWVLSIAVSHPQFDEHLAKGLLQTPPPDVKMVDDPHRWRQRTTVLAASDMGWLELLSEKSNGNAVLLGPVEALTASAPRVLQHVRQCACACDNCDSLARRLNEKLERSSDASRLLLVQSSQLWDAFEPNSVDALVLERAETLLHMKGQRWLFTDKSWHGMALALNSSGIVLGVQLQAPNLPAGFTLNFGEGFWWFQWIAKEATAVSVPFGDAAKFAARSLQTAGSEPPVLVALLTRYAYSNARLAIRCAPAGDRLDLSPLVTELDAAQQALRGRVPGAEEMILAVSSRTTFLLDQEMPNSCPVQLPGQESMMSTTAAPPQGIHPIPLVGFGTHELNGMDCYTAVRAALEAGVRHIDTAEGYQNAASIAQAVQDSKVPREQIFVATKLSSTGFDEEVSYRILAKELESLGGYAELCYLHFPSNQNLPGWRALERLHSEQRCKSLGLSNFQQSEIQQIMDRGKVKPVALQIQFSIYEPPSPVFLRWLRSEKILVVAAASLNPNATANLNPMEDPHVQRIAAGHGRTAAQVLLRWLVQQSVAVLPRSRSVQHILENRDLDFQLTNRELRWLNGLSTLMQSLGQQLRPEGATDVFGLR
ncbi:unnamed protein product [Cladocopium goreaui]|uniref:9,11-endoperoxide prostaglandin H2 reductase (Prostaglandin F2-alpha synthase) n=1 Tax=Cladocopium goreaui TaxID=2562237 RepID=A0A9P1GKP9_9DINO|nr:unnamed protein product [Cladocopium goreaui]